MDQKQEPGMNRASGRALSPLHFRLPDYADQEKARASYKQGLLTITFPKREEAKARHIQIEG